MDPQVYDISSADPLALRRHTGDPLQLVIRTLHIHTYPREPAEDMQQDPTDSKGDMASTDTNPACMCPSSAKGDVAARRNPPPLRSKGHRRDLRPRGGMSPLWVGGTLLLLLLHGGSLTHVPRQLRWYPLVHFTHS